MGESEEATYIFHTENTLASGARDSSAAASTQMSRTKSQKAAIIKKII